MVEFLQQYTGIVKLALRLCVDFPLALMGRLRGDRVPGWYGQAHLELRAEERMG